MATKEAKAKPDKPASTAAAAPKAPRAPKAPQMSMVQRFELMGLVKAADPTLPDSTVAAAASKQLGRNVLQSTVAEYRKQFGLQSVRKPSPAALAAYIEVLTAALTAAGLPVPPMAVETAEQAAAADASESTQAASDAA